MPGGQYATPTTFTTVTHTHRTPLVRHEYVYDENVGPRYMCWVFLAIVFVLILVDAALWFPHSDPSPSTTPRLPRDHDGAAYGWAAIALALVYTLVAVGFVWMVEDGVDGAFALIAIVVFAFAAATVAAVPRHNGDGGGWVVVLLFCLLVLAFVGACGHAVWRWRTQVYELERRRANTPYVKKRLGWAARVEGDEEGEEGGVLSKDTFHLPPLTMLPSS